MRTKKEKCDCLNYCGDDHQRIISGLVDPCESYKSAQARAKIDNRDRRQKTILAWARQTFGISVADNTEERIKRLIEEALELAQAVGLEKSAVMTLTDYVYSRQKGVITQEIGQVGVTLMALAEHLGISAENAEFNEVLRITSKDPEHFKRGRMQNRPMVLV